MRWEDFLAEHPDYVRLGHDHVFHFTYGRADSYQDLGWPHRTEEDGELVLVGIVEYHRDPNGNTCGGYATFARPLAPGERDRPIWKVQSIDPLTISPSLQCRSCPSHGHIRSGRWVPA